MKLIATSTALAAAWIALLLATATAAEARKVGLRHAGRALSLDPQRQIRGRSLNDTPECAICKDMYDTLKESTSILSCETTCDAMAETLGGGPEDRTCDGVVGRPTRRAARVVGCGVAVLGVDMCVSLTRFFRSISLSLSLPPRPASQPSRTWSWKRATLCARSSSTGRRRARARGRPARTSACARPARRPVR
jgi:hypothetical protein